MRLSRLQSLGVVAAFAVVVGACGSESGTVLAGNAPDGYQRVENSSEGFSMVVPAEWAILDADDIDADDFIAETVGSMPELAGMEEELRGAIDQGVVFWAFDFDDPQTGFINNINVIKAPRGGMSAEALQELNAQQLASMFGTQPSSKLGTSLQGYEVVRMEYAVPAYGVRGIGALVLTDDTQWVITLAITQGTALDFDFDVLVDLFRET